MLLGVFPELTGIGGIQQVSRHAGAALCDLANQKGEAWELIGLTDPAGEGWFTVGQRRYGFQGFARNRRNFVAHLVKRAPKTSLLFANHIHLGPPALAAATIAPRLRYWLVAHGFEVWQPLPLYRAMALRRAHGIIAVSRNTAEAVQRIQRVPREKITVLSPALEPDDALAPAETISPPWPSGSHVLLTAARLAAREPGKGLDTVIQALPRLLPAFPNLYYVIVGDGDARPALEKLAIENGVSGRVIFTGACSRESLRRYYEIADIFVMPSRQEGFGIAFLEAMAAGKPVVACACGGAPEVVRDGETGYLVEYGDVFGLAKRLDDLLSNDLLRTRMGETGRNIVAEEYQFEQFRDRMIALLEGGDRKRR
jgi:phosphatidylinositol alpha-1,6-mannosyltransferase